MLTGSWSLKVRFCTPQDKAKLLRVLGQVGQSEKRAFPLVQVVQLKGLEVADQDVARALLLGQGVEIVAGLPVGAGEVAPGAFLLDQQHAGPEQVDEAGRFVEALDALLIASDGAPLDTEDIEEVVVEAVRLSFLIGCVLPLFDKCRGPDADFIPGEAHSDVAFCWSGVNKERLAAERSLVCLRDELLRFPALRGVEAGE